MDGLSDNLILFTDSYKITHHLQYPPDLSYIKAYFESRGGKYDATVFFGLQYVLKRYLEQRITNEMIEEADEILKKHFGRSGLFNREGWEYIVSAHGGRLPLRIRAVPEGTLVPTREVLFTVESTDPKVAWLTNYVETALVEVWYPLTVCTNSFMQKVVIAKYLRETSDDLSLLPFKLHDFGFRGATTREAAGLGGLAHLVNFKGTDTLEALRTARNFYPSAQGEEQSVAGFSIPATEHSTMTTWGSSRELEATEHMLNTFSQGAVSIVSDSYDLWNYIDNIVGEKLKEMVENRSAPLVIRPDSGDPVENVLKVLAKLEAKFGATTNSKGFKMLPNYIRVIQGDGICYESVCKILEAMKCHRWCTDNITFGSGGALLQKLNRDTQKCAYKCCLAKVGDSLMEVYKDPVTDPGKKSKAGDLVLVQDNQAGGRLRTIKAKDKTDQQVDAMVTVYENGVVLKSWSLEEVRTRADLALEDRLNQNSES